MVYTHKTFKSGKQLKEAVKAGEKITVYQPGPFGPGVRDGYAVVEMPKYPEAHRYYVGVIVEDGVIVKVK